MNDGGTRDRVGYALVGAGAIADIQARALSRVPRARLTAIYSRSAVKARALADQYGIPWTTDYDRLLDMPDVYAVSICTPSGARVEPATAAAHAGKHVICEKPLEVTLERADRIIAACENAGVWLGVLFPMRYTPAACAVREAVVGGRLGTLTMASAHVKWYRSADYYASASWRGTWALDGGGALMNQSIHWIDLLQWLGGEIRAVTGYVAHQIHRQIEVEDTGVAILRFRNGALGTIEGTTTAFPGLPARLELHGDRGTIVLEEQRVIVWKPADGSLEEERRLRVETDTAAGGGSDPLAIGAEAHRRQFVEITAALLAGRAPAVDGHEGRKALAIIRAIYESAQAGSEVAVSLDGARRVEKRETHGSI
jgi:UDP-N-acetyl-2-amino-2-deoxyglucuronate dehydrogenase